MLTEKEARMIRSSFANGIEYINLNTEKTNSLLYKLNIAIKKQVPISPLIDKPSKINYVQTYTCPSCLGSFSGKVCDYCYHCGQKLDWDNL